MKADQPEIPNSWYAAFKGSIATARAGLAEAQELLEKAERGRDPGISPGWLAPLAVAEKVFCYYLWSPRAGMELANHHQDHS